MAALLKGAKAVGSAVLKKVTGTGTKRGRKRIRGRPTAAVAKVMKEEGVGRREAEKIVRERSKKVIKKRAPVAAPIVKRTRREERELERLIRDQNKDMINQRTLMGRVPTGPDRRSIHGLDPTKGPVVEQGPPKSQVLFPPGRLSTAQRRRFALTGQGKPVARTRQNPRGMVETGGYAPPRREIAEQMRGGGKADPDMEEILQMVKEGKLTLQKKGGQVRAKKRSKSKPRGVGKAMRGWGVVSKGRR